MPHCVRIAYNPRSRPANRIPACRGERVSGEAESGKRTKKNMHDELREIWDSIDDPEREADEVGMDWQRVAHERMRRRYDYDLSSMDTDTMIDYEDRCCRDGLASALRWLDGIVERIIGEAGV